MLSPRMNALTQWATEQSGTNQRDITLTSAGGDASFRNYFRLSLPDKTTRIVMDAPPEREDSAPFIAIGQRWHAAGLPVPTIYAHDTTQGFLLLDDLGDAPLQDYFTNQHQTLHYTQQALSLIGKLQNSVSPAQLPAYDAALLGRELDLFPDWCLSAWLSLPVPDSWLALRAQLIEQALTQPVVSVHRDFDAMNLMVLNQHIYMIDFQDAVAGPISYDLISLLRGRYWRFSAEQFAHFVQLFYTQAQQDGRLTQRTSEAAFLHQCQAMAAQRSLKILGIFCRLTLRDHRQGYLARLPHFVDHLADSLAALPDQLEFSHWVQETLSPAINRKLKDAGL